MKTYPIIIKASNYTIEIYQPPGDFEFPTKEERERWTAALRSGDYQQGKYRLSPVVGYYCCLGVLQFLRDGRKPTQEEHASAHDLWGDALNTIGTAKNWECGDLPNGVAVILSNSNSYEYLTDLNDKGMSFADIADIIDITLNPETY